ncbi:MAG: clostripain-related cysteine peptidase [Thermacetogeniaceae bacterium]
MLRDIRQWTLLIYASGNNELEPEMWQARLDAEQTGSSGAVDVVMQLGRENRDLVRILRPMHLLPDAQEHWTGVRRYYIWKGRSDLLADLGSINMADPESLYEFIRWGLQSYPARHCLLALGGHALQLVGMITDYSQDAPYIMGLPELARTLGRIREDTGKTIDILVLDTCHMNAVEAIYELGHEVEQAVQNVITFIEEGPIAGLPYGRLIHLVQQHADKDTTSVSKEIIDGLQADLVAFEVNCSKLRGIKKAVHDYACDLLRDPGREEAVVPDPRHLDDKLASLIIHHHCLSPHKHLITLAAKMVPLLEPFYCRLAFARNNAWTRWLLNKKESADGSPVMGNKLEPTNLPKTALCLYIKIMNPSLDQKQADMILQELLFYKNWRLD